MEQLEPSSWNDYELLDAGNFEKLERYGMYVLIRPEPRALWPRTHPTEEWNRRAHVRFVRDQKDRYRFTDDIKGGWKQIKKIPESWQVQYAHGALQLQLRLALTGFGHVGVFPEQGANWNFIMETVTQWNRPGKKVLNLFAYTGAASVVACLGGADVTHVDSSRPALNWANQNMQINGCSGIRWVHEDALKFIRREVRRGNKYDGVIMDPPPYGRGPNGEKWLLPEQLDELVSLSAKLLDGKQRFLILNLYAGLSPIVSLNVVRAHFPGSNPGFGELVLKSAASCDLPMGTFVRFAE